MADCPEKALSKLRERHWCKWEKVAAVISAKCVEDHLKTIILENKHITAADKAIHRKLNASGRIFYDMPIRMTGENISVVYLRFLHQYLRSVSISTQSMICESTSVVSAGEI